MKDEEISIFPTYQVVYGTFWQRAAALLIDTILLYFLGLFVNLFFSDPDILTQLSRHEEISRNNLIATVIEEIPGWLYFALMESSSKQATLGKMVMGLKVTDIDGGRISFVIATGRYFSMALSLLTICIGFLMMLWNDKHQTLHDKLAGTLVVKRSSLS